MTLLKSLDNENIEIHGLSTKTKEKKEGQIEQALILWAKFTFRFKSE